jgi:hypothetical protein
MAFRNIFALSFSQIFHISDIDNQKVSPFYDLWLQETNWVVYTFEKASKTKLHLYKVALP